MNIVFATCERQRALAFLKKLYPSSVVEDTEDSAKDLLDIIEADEIRVCDPDFHRGQMNAGKNFNDTTMDRTQAALEKAGLWFLRANT